LCPVVLHALISAEDSDTCGTDGIAKFDQFVVYQQRERSGKEERKEKMNEGINNSENGWKRKKEKKNQ
jgi:hypothetical protein